MPLFYHKTVSYLLALPVSYLTTLYNNLDPILFDSDLKVEIMDMGIGISRAADRKKNKAAGLYDDLKGWRRIGKYLGYKAQQSDIGATCFWYQTEPHTPLEAVTPAAMV